MVREILRKVLRLEDREILRWVREILQESPEVGGKGNLKENPEGGAKADYKTTLFMGGAFVPLAIKIPRCPLVILTIQFVK